MTRRILLVDDDPAVLDALAGALKAVPGEWAAESATTLPDALRWLAASTFDVVVADAGSRSVDGRWFLDEVAARQPAAVRFLLTPSAGRGMLVRAGGPVHQFLDKPVRAEAAFARLGRTLAMGDLLADPHLRGFVARLTAVPSLPPIYVAIMAELRQDEASALRIGETVARDPGMTAKLLQLVNSPFFGFGMCISDPVQAVQLLGLDTVRALVLSLNIFERLDQRTVARFRLAKVWRHSLGSGACARLVARLQGGSAEAVSEAATAALLHDIGKLVLAGALPDDYARVIGHADGAQVPMWTAERDVLHTTHAEVGAYLLGLWGLPEPVVEAVAWHHRPGECPSPAFGALGAVHVADVIQHTLHPADAVGRIAPADEAYLERHQVSWQVPAWTAACQDERGEGQGRGRAARE